MALFAIFDWLGFANDSGQRVIVSMVVAAIMATISFTVGRYWGWFKANREWRNKEFMNRVIVSLNLFDDGYLRIRTILERSLNEVFLNQVAVEKVLSAAKQCTLTQPILPIPKEDRWYLLNFALNAVAEQFSVGVLKLDAGLKPTRLKYLLFLTCEVVGDERIRKVRVMLIKEETLQNFPYWEDLPKFENPWHEVRIATLRAAAKLYATEPDQFLLLEVYL